MRRKEDKISKGGGGQRDPPGREYLLRTRREHGRIHVEAIIFIISLSFNPIGCQPSQSPQNSPLLKLCTGNRNRWHSNNSSTGAESFFFFLSK